MTMSLKGYAFAEQANSATAEAKRVRTSVCVCVSPSVCALQYDRSRRIIEISKALAE